MSSGLAGYYCILVEGKDGKDYCPHCGALWDEQWGSHCQRCYKSGYEQRDEDGNPMEEAP